MLQHSSWCTDQDIHSSQSFSLLLKTAASDDQTCREGVITSDLAQDLEDLDGKLSRRRYDQSSKSVQFGPFLAIEVLQNRNQERQCLSATSLCCSEDIMALQGEWNCLGLNVGQGLEVGGIEAFRGR